MNNKVTVDYITHNPDKSEFALYLVEFGPWVDVPMRKNALQDRVYNAIDVVLDGQLASDYPDSKGARIRVEVVFKEGEVPVDMKNLVLKLDEIVMTADDYVRDVRESGYASSLRVVYSEEN